MTVPDFQSLMLPVLRAAADGDISAADLRERIASELGLSEDDLAERLPKGGQTVFVNRVAWANIYLQRAGLLQKAGRATYRVTEEGRALLAQAPDRVDLGTLSRYPSYVEWRRGRLPDPSIEVDSGAAIPSKPARTPEEEIAASYAAMSAALETDLLDRVRGMSPAFFENLIIDLLIAMGYGGGQAEMGQSIGRSGDGGIDGMIKEDALGLDIVYVQAKRYTAQNTVGRNEVQSFAGSLDGVRATKGIFVTTSSFSQGAREFVDASRSASCWSTVPSSRVSWSSTKSACEPAPPTS